MSKIILIAIIVVIAGSITITLAQKENASYESFKTYIQERLSQLSGEEKSQLEKFQELSPIDKFIQAGNINQDETKQTDSSEAKDE